MCNTSSAIQHFRRIVLIRVMSRLKMGTTAIWQWAHPAQP